MLLTGTVFLSLLHLLIIASIHGHGLDHIKHRNEHRQRLAPRQTNTTNNGLLFQGFEWYVKKDGQHWNRLNSQLGKLAEIGVDRLWVPPPTKAGANPSTGYDVYDLWDLGEFNQTGHVRTSYGTKAQLEDLSQNASLHGISLLVDAVLNQRSGADSPTSCQAYKVNSTNRLQNISEPQTIQAWVGFEYPGRGTKYSNKTWGCNDFTAVDYDNESKENAVWKMEGQNNAFAMDVSTENGNYDFLILADVAYENPSVQEDVKSWGAWVANELGLGGFRIDAAKHISRAFLNNWVGSIKSQPGQSDLLFIAEYLASDVGTVESFVDGFNTTISVFDTPLQEMFHSFSTGAQTDLRTVFNNTWLVTRPEQAAVYVNNHDTQIGQSLQSLNVGGWFVPLAYALILLRQEGYPCVFYADLYGAYNSTNNFTEPAYAQQIADLALARKYFGYGNQTNYFDDANQIGWTREGNGDHPDGLAVIMSNAQGGTQNLRMNVGVQHAGEVWSSLFGSNGNVIIDGQGWADFVAGAGTVNIFSGVNAGHRAEFGTWSSTIYDATASG